MPKLSFAIPKALRLQTVKVDNLRAGGPGWIVFEEVSEEVVTIIRDNRDGITLADGECVHYDLVRMLVDTVDDRMFQVLEVM